MGINKSYYGVEFFPDLKTSQNYISEKTFKKKAKPKPTLTFKRIEHEYAGPNLGQPKKEYGVNISKKGVGVYFKKKFKKGGYSQGTCWDGYVQKGMKKKGNKMVPNCVPAGKMKTGGLTKWFSEKWVDIGSKKKGGGFRECGRKSASGSKRKYPKCVPAAKAARMTESQRRSAVARKRSKAQGVGGKPTNVKTFAKKA